uniref:Uncharacterized protein n=1 Tax=Leersia perrieri TaxID=77586 RepID=A0A0D9VF62_9ORYZ
MVTAAKCIKSVTRSTCTMSNSNHSPNMSQYVKETPIMVNKNLVGATSQRVFFVMTDEATLVIRAIIIELYFLHKMERCPQHFDESNVYIRGDGIAQLRECNLDDKSDSKVFENYQDAQKIIVETVFQQHMEDIPKDVMHLLELMNTPDQAISIELEHFICKHASLVPIRNRETCFLWMYRHIMFLPSDKLKGDMPYKSYWYKKLKGNDMLQKLFWGEKDTNDFLKSYRNAIVHSMDNYGERRSRYTPGDIQQILCTTFPFLLPRMQQELWENEELGDLQLDSLFGYNLDNEFGVIMNSSAVSNRKKSNKFSFQVGSMSISANQDKKKDGAIFLFR